MKPASLLARNAIRALLNLPPVPKCTTPAIFHVASGCIYPMNELARDAMGEAFRTTKYITASDFARRTLERTTLTPGFHYCGARFYGKLGEWK